MIDPAHIHPMVVHFPLVLLPLAVVVMIVARARAGTLGGRSCLQTSAVVLTVLTVLAALSAIVAAVFGDIAAEAAVAAGFAETVVETHESLGVATAVLLPLLALGHLWLFLRRPAGRAADWLVLLGAIALSGLILVTAYYGGDLVYGLGVNVQPVVQSMGS